MEPMSRFLGNVFIVLAVVLLIVNSQWAHFAAVVCAILGVGSRIEAAITAARLPDDK